MTLTDYRFTFPRLRTALRQRVVRAGLFAALAVTGCGTGSPTGGSSVPAPALPSIASLTPASAVAGSGAFSLNVSGSNFTSASVVTWNNSARPTTLISATTLTAQITAADVATAGSAAVAVQTTGAGTSASMTFTISQAPNALPVLSSISPVSAIAGTAGMTITATGTAFVSGSQVLWNGTARATNFVSGTSLTAQVTAADLLTAGIAAVTVSTPAPGGGVSAAQLFTINNPLPVLTSLAPATGIAGTVGATLTLNGSNFVSSSLVSINGTARAATFVSAAILTVQLTATDLAAAGSLAVFVMNSAPGGGSSATLTFANGNPVPIITSVSPAGAIAGSIAPAITVSGSNFVAGAQALVNGAARTTTVTSSTSLLVQLASADVTTAGTLSIAVSNPVPGGGVSATQGFLVSNPVPTLSSVSSAGVLAGATPPAITLNGTGFVSGSQGLVNGNTRTTTFVSATSLIVQLTSADVTAAGVLSVTVANAAPGGGTSSVQSFTVDNPVPTLTSLSPASAIAGNSPITVTLSGSSFTPSAQVLFDGAARTTAYVSSTSLSAQLTAADLSTAGTATVAVMNPTPGGGMSAALTFTINAPVPVLTSLTPSSALTGSAATVVSVSGSGFTNSSVVNVNGSARATSFVSATSLTAQFTASDFASASALSVTVITPGPGGGSSVAIAFGVNNAMPVLTSLSPTSAIAGGGPLVLTVMGSGFGTGSTVLWSGSARVTTFVSATSLTAQITASDVANAGTASVSVLSPTPGGGTSAALQFAINAPVPVLTSVSPASALVGLPALNVAVNGSSFASNSVVQVNGSARATSFGSATSLTVQLTAADLATATALSVTVVTPTPGGGSSSAVTFTVNNPVPTLTAFAPSTAVAGSPAFSLTLNGTNFVAGSQVLWNGSARATTFVSASTLMAQITAADVANAGTASVAVANAGPGGGNSGAFTFAITLPAPTLSSLSPASVLVGSGALTVTATGANFDSTSVVQLNGTARTTTFVSATSLTAQLTAADIATAGTFTLTVVSASAGTSNGLAFSVNNPVPTLNSLSPANVTMHENPLTLTVSGSNFVTGALIAWNGVTRPTVRLSSTVLTAEVGFADLNSAGTGAISVVNPGPGGGPSGSLNFAVADSTASGFPSCTDVDINLTTPKGSASVSGSTVTVSGGGNITGAADALNFCYVPAQGNFQLIARVNQPTSSAAVNSGSEVGLMVRESTDPASRMEMIYVQGANAQVGTVRRQLAGDTDIQRLKVFNPAPTFPFWLRLQRYGDLFSLDYSYDGIVYQSALSTQSIIGLNPNVLVGFGVASRTSSVLTTVFDNVSLTPLVTPSQPVTDWYGNTFGGGGSFMIPRGQALATDAAGNLYVQGQGEEESAEVLDTNGNFITYPTISHFNTEPGIAYDTKNNYVWESGAPFVSSGGTAKGGIAYSKPTDGTYLGAMLQTGSGSNQTAARTIYGIAIYNNVLYGIDAANQATPSDTAHVTVHTISLQKPFAETTPFLVAAGATYMAIDTSGNIWIVFTGTSPYVEKYDHLGNYLNVHISGFIDPRGIATDPAGNVYVTEYGPALQQIFVYDTKGNPLTTLGATGGLRSTCNGTTVNQYDPCKLDHPEGIAIDTNGNLYVASNGPSYNNAGGYGGMVLRKYNNVAGNLNAGLSSANLAWHREGLMYIDAGAIDPNSQSDLYSRQRHFKFDYNQPAGQGWSVYGLGVDEVAYPNDQRVQARYDAAAWFRTINGHKFIVSTTEYSSQLDFFLIQSNSEVQIPYASFVRETARGVAGDSSTIWVDTNLNGQVDSGETAATLPPQAAPPSAEYLEYYVDTNGDVWTGVGTNTSTKVLRYKMTLLPNGYPTWSAANTLSYPAPAAFQANVSGSQTSILREVYNPDTDTMYLGGYTAAVPKPSSGYPVGALGTQILRYDNFTGAKGAQMLGCTINVPLTPDLNGTAGTGNAAKAMDVAGALLAVEYDFSNVVTLYQNTGSCAQVTAFSPGPEVGGTEGTLDSENTLMMQYRGAPSNEYLIFSEEGGQHKVIMYRYIYP